MLELYHHGSSVCAAKVRIYLAEKGLDWSGHYIDILKGDQFDPAYIKLNPKAVVPTLLHDGDVICDSTVICEYIENTFVERPLRPEDPLQIAKVMEWTKAVDEELHPACAWLTFLTCHRHIILRLGDQGVEDFLNSTPRFSVTSNWLETKKSIVRNGFQAEGAEAKVRLYDYYLHKMESALEKREWLASDSFTFADIAIMPYVNRLDMLSLDQMWKNGRLPGVENWFSRIKARDSFKPMLLDWCPEDLTNDLRDYGKTSWPEVRKILGIP